MHMQYILGCEEVRYCIDINLQSFHRELVAIDWEPEGTGVY